MLIPSSTEDGNLTANAGVYVVHKLGLMQEPFSPLHHVAVQTRFAKVESAFEQSKLKKGESNVSVILPEY